ncbi:hypothetical protein B296_00047056 [Ensete ventricosum]|uniref:Uncharacterized protein n=1 Tax=Ensete ventricosum TaxID=4639 RepID=A0A426X5C6_ENSVE|nr:hypothetical protein B296_00047056 [Ensete ventricosum]
MLMSDLGHQDPEKEMKAKMEGAEEFDESLEQLVGSGGVREGTAPPPTGAGALYAPLGSPNGLSRQGDSLVAAKAKGRAAELQEELKRTKWERDEALIKREASKTELHEVWSNLTDAQRLLKETRVKAQKMDDELLHAVKALDSTRAELPRQMVAEYMESLGFKEGLKRMGRVTYDYGYRVSLALVHA